MDAYESDLLWIRYGQPLQFTVRAYPGQVFSARIAFIQPTLDERTRTVKVRANVDNQDGQLKPGMFVTATVLSRIAGAGKVIDPSLTGKWICPMHPEIVKDKPSTCDLCGMPLESAEQLGYVVPELQETPPPLVIPVSAPLITGKRAVAYVKAPGQTGVYESRDVVLGPKAGDYYLVESGLEQGEKVVVNGNFRLDSELQIQGKRSMMSAEQAGGSSHELQETFETTFERHLRKPRAPKSSEKFLLQFDKVLENYFTLHTNLSQDDFERARETGKQIISSLQDVKAEGLSESALRMWEKQSQQIEVVARAIGSSSTIEGARKQFQLLSESILEIVKEIGTSGKIPIFRFHCSMAFNNRGADWLQNRKGTENPYFGDAMFRCGKQVETLSKPPRQAGHTINEH